MLSQSTSKVLGKAQLSHDTQQHPPIKSRHIFLPVVAPGSGPAQPPAVRCSMTPQVEDDPAESPGVFPESGVRSRSYVVGRDEGMKAAVVSGFLACF